MSFESTLNKYNGVSQSRAFEIVFEAFGRAAELAEKHPQYKDDIKSSTILVMFLFAAADSSVDEMEYDAFTNVYPDMSREKYFQLVEASADEKQIESIYQTVRKVMRAVPGMKEVYSDIAMLTIISNGEIDKTEVALFTVFFDV